MLNIFLCGVVYVIMVYLMVKLLKKKNIKLPPDDGDDGGLEVENTPKIDLPPGVCWPGPGGSGGSVLTREETENFSY
ncbi:hypothetical protein AB9P05_10365 [Roseivirga sp. BDSF3-8]|uniref:hypothetical protein n=1 Tax=Roseivirga sp. BDSF3-8 TaxID=3241598 RepID=UPI0035323ABE